LEGNKNKIEFLGRILFSLTTTAMNRLTQIAALKMDIASHEAAIAECQRQIHCLEAEEALSDRLTRDQWLYLSYILRLRKNPLEY
jgi:hypothetical protein